MATATPIITQVKGLSGSEAVTFLRGGLPPRLLHRICEYIDANLEQNIKLDHLAYLARLSKHHFSRAFKRSLGVAPHAYLIGRRIDRACTLLSMTDMPLVEIALTVGFSDQSHFACRFRQQVGMAPSAYRWTHR